MGGKYPYSKCKEHIKSYICTLHIRIEGSVPYVIYVIHDDMIERTQLGPITGKF